MKLNKNDLYWTNKKHTTYAVLVSPGYGCGWSTWNKDELAYDKRVYDSDSFCYSGIRTIEVRKIDINAIWNIKVSDGHEELQIVNVNENEWKICGD